MMMNAIAMEGGSVTREEPWLGVGRHRRRRVGMFCRRDAQRVSVEGIVARARFLAPGPRALICAYFDLSMPLAELAALHRMPARRLYQVLTHWRDLLSDPMFLLAARYGEELAGELGEVARAHWMEGATLREVAAVRRTTLHEVRRMLAEAKVALVEAAARRRARMTNDE